MLQCISTTNQGLPLFSSILVSFLSVTLWLGNAESSITHVEPTCGANQSFTFLSTPAVPKINAGTPPEEIKSYVI